MRDDISTLLRDAAADPSHTPDFDALAARGRRQHLAARASTALAAVVALMAGSIVLWPDGQPAQGPVIGDQPTTPDQDEKPAALTETEATEANLATPRPVADHPDPLTRAGAAGVKIACDGPAHLGGWAPDFGGPAVGASDPEGSLQAFLDQGLFGLPQDGYEMVASEPGRVLFTYTVDGNPKVAVIVADSTVVDEQLTVDSGWGIETFATCDPAEYAPATDDELGQTVWTDRDGNRVPTSTITSFPGPAHCGWQSVTFLHLNDRQYLRDPQGLLDDQVVNPYDGDTRLPADATDTGYRNSDQELWLGPDADTAYVVTDTTVEAWPATTDRVACA